MGGGRSSLAVYLRYSAIVYPLIPAFWKAAIAAARCVCWPSAPMPLPCLRGPGGPLRRSDFLGPPCDMSTPSRPAKAAIAAECCDELDDLVWKASLVETTPLPLSLRIASSFIDILDA